MTFSDYLWYKHKLKPDDVEPTSSRGYWRIKRRCGGLGVCRHPIHRCIGNEGGVHHTIYYTDYNRGKDGRFKPPYQTWNYFRRLGQTPARISAG